MCGFTGLINRSISDNTALLKIEKAVAALRHRGPDDFGIYVNKDIGVYLGHTRLSVIDTSARAHQPMVSSCGNYVIVYNGEIYNYRELFSRYCPQDGSVNGHSDTSVLLYLFSRFGRSCLEMLDGMFAFAVINLKEGTTFLARDRFGEKPLYLINEGNQFAFSSELRGLRALLSDWKWEIDYNALIIYHVIGSIPAPKTIFRKVYSLMPGSWMELKLDSAPIEGHYWSLEDSLTCNEPRHKSNYADAILRTRDYLRGAIRSRMVSDVPVGIFLSGGYDSSAMVGLCADQDVMPDSTLIVDFEEEEFSEFNQAKIAAHHYGVELIRHVLVEDMFIRGLKDYFANMDQPTTDGYNTYFISLLARETGIKVWLSGVGGDELFGGYPFFHRIRYLKRLSFVLQLIISKWLIDILAPELQEHLRYSRVLHLSERGDTVLRAYQCCRNIFPWHNVQKIFPSAVWNEAEEFPKSMDGLYPQIPSDIDDFQGASLLEASTYMRSQLLRDIDNFSMTHSIELRAPFLDHHLFSFVLRLPRRFKQRAGLYKPLLADSLPRPLPSSLINQKKRGFTFPIETWLKRGIKASFEEVVLNKVNAQFWDLKEVTRMWRACSENRIHWGVMWAFYAFACWYRELR